MAGIKVFDMTAAAAIAAGDLVPVVDVSDTTGDANGTTKKSTITNFFGGVPVDIVSVQAVDSEIEIRAGTGDARLHWQVNTTGQDWYMGVNNNVSNQLAISLNAGLTTPAAFFSVAGNRPTFPQGLVFNDETLDTYDEGTWSAALTDGTNDAVGGITNCKYIKVGKLCFIFGKISISTLGSVSGDIFIKGLPFTADSGTDCSIHFSSASSLEITAGRSITGFVDISSVRITLQLWDVTTGVTPMQATKWSDGGGITLSGFYKTT